MSLQAFTAKWFALYYSILGLILFSLGIYLIIKSDVATTYLMAHSTAEQRPRLLRTMVKYFFLFSLPCLFFSFFPFSWPELLFSIWSLMMVYLAGIPLVHWPQMYRTIEEHPQKNRRMIQRMGAAMMAVSVAIFLLGYLVIQQFFAHR